MDHRLCSRNPGAVKQDVRCTQNFCLCRLLVCFHYIFLFLAFDLPICTIKRIFTGEQGWRSDESARLPPVWPGFDSRSRCHMCIEFVVGSRPCSERFFSGEVRLSPLPKNQHFQISIRSRAHENVLTSF